MSLFDLNEEQMKKFCLERTIDNEFCVKETDFRVVGIDLEDEVIVAVPFFRDRVYLDEIREICLSYDIIPVFGRKYWEGKLEVTWESDKEWADSLIESWVDCLELIVLRKRRFNCEKDIEVYKKITS